MRVLAVTSTHLYVACGRVVLVTSLNSTESSCWVPPNEVNEEARLTTLVLSHGEDILIGGYDDKNLVTWSTADGNVLGRKEMKKKPQVICSASFLDPQLNQNQAAPRNVVLCADKFGEIYALDYELKKSVMIGGHPTSIITDMYLPSSPWRGVLGLAISRHSG